MKKKPGRKPKPEHEKMIQKGVSLTRYQWEQLGQFYSAQIRAALEMEGYPARPEIQESKGG